MTSNKLLSSIGMISNKVQIEDILVLVIVTVNFLIRVTEFQLLLFESKGEKVMDEWKLLCDKRVCLYSSTKIMAVK
jgi:hypothetical protein